MLPFSSRIASSDFLEFSNKALSNETSKEELSHNPWDTSTDEDVEDCFEFYSDSPVIPAPASSDVAIFKASSFSLASSPASVRSSKPVYSKYDLNWTSIDDYLDNWNILPTEDQYRLRALVVSDTKHNCYRFGLKTKNLETHLLLSIGSELTGILGSKSDAVLANLKSRTGSYSKTCVDNRTIDPKTCFRAASKFKKERDVESLFKKRFVAYQAVISSDDSYRKLGADKEAARSRYMDFFKLNAESLAYLLKKKKISSYCYSHEISVDSILEQKYRPHTHLIVFLPDPGYDLESQRMEVEDLESQFNSALSDRKMSFVRMEVDGVNAPKSVRKYPEIEKSFSYFFRAYCLADQYMREIREDNIQSLNKATVECYRDLVWLFKPDSLDNGKCVRRFRTSMIPKFDKPIDLETPESPEVLPPLQKEKKEAKIKKANKIIQETIAHESSAPSKSVREDVSSSESSNQRHGRYRSEAKHAGTAIQRSRSSSTAHGRLSSSAKSRARRISDERSIQNGRQRHQKRKLYKCPEESWSDSY